MSYMQMYVVRPALRRHDDQPTSTFQGEDWMGGVGRGLLVGKVEHVRRMHRRLQQSTRPSLLPNTFGAYRPVQRPSRSPKHSSINR